LSQRGLRVATVAIVAVIAALLTRGSALAVTPPTVTSALRTPPATLPGSYADAATVTGDPSDGTPTGQVTFSVCGPNALNCATGGREIGTAVELTPAGDAGTARSSAFTPKRSGRWCFRTDYSGDSNYDAASDAGTGVCFKVPKRARPSVTIKSPKDGSVYVVDQVAHVSYHCSDPAGAAGIASCTGDLANGARLDTRTPGRHSFTVVAQSKDGEIRKVTHHYTMIPPELPALERFASTASGSRAAAWCTTPRQCAECGDRSNRCHAACRRSGCS
jgi:hypothetical protein